MSEAEAATAQWITAVPPEVCRDAKATVPPAALVSLVMALAVAVPVAAAGKAEADKAKLATVVEGAATVEPVM